MHPYFTIGLSVLAGFLCMVVSVMVLTVGFLSLWVKVFTIKRCEAAPMSWTLFNLSYSAACAAFGGFTSYYVAGALAGAPLELSHTLRRY